MVSWSSEKKFLLGDTSIWTCDNTESVGLTSPALFTYSTSTGTVRCAGKGTLISDFSSTLSNGPTWFFMKSYNDVVCENITKATHLVSRPDHIDRGTVIDLVT
jgi:hypothetical protein